MEEYKQMMQSEGYVFVGTNSNSEIIFEHRDYGTSIRFSSWDKIPGYLNAYAA